MRSTLLRLALALALTTVGSVAFAQFGFRPKVKIENPRVGFRPAGGNERGDGGIPQFVSKAGVWAPLWFNLEMLADDSRGMRLEVTTSDGDGFKTSSSTPILRARDTNAGEQPRKQGERIEYAELSQSTLVRVGGMAESVRMQIVSDDDGRVSLSDPVQIERLRDRPVSTFVVLSLGASIPGLEFPSPNQNQNRQAEGPYLRNGRVELAKVESVQEMPDQWFGYSGADLVIIGTGKPDKGFITELFTGTSAMANRKRWALFEWVRRGGSLVVSVAERSDEVRASEVFADILPVAVGQALRQPVLKSANFGETNNFIDLKNTPRKPGDPADPFPVATFTAKAGKRPPTVLLTDTSNKPLVAQQPLGLGRVTAVAIDLDRSPFADYALRTNFWDWLVRTVGGRAADLPERAAKAANANNANLSAGGPEDGAASAIRSNVDAFEGVPVISFGWVALFILGYTLLIGPIEYLFLKKVLGRLELTWVTFPLIVLTVSAAAYFTAYAVKGKDLRINKIDVIDIDPRDEGRVYGRTWFTIFSPRIDSYTIGVQPKENWAVEPPAGPTPPTLVDWFGNTGGTGISASARSYKYQIDPLNDLGRSTGPANGLERVPIQVWSTKAFTANWSGLPAGNTPVVTSDISRQPAGGVDGTITLNLPIKDVQEAFAVYRGEVFQLDPGSVAGLPIRFNPAITPKVDQSPFKTDSRFELSDRNDDDFGANSRRGRFNPQATAPSTTFAALPLWGLLFHEEASRGQELQNSTLRGLDQSWRVNSRNADEVILLIRLKRANGSAEEMMTAPDAASPTKLWLKGLPGSGPRTEVPGVMQQDTYIRVYVPVKPAGGR